MLTFVQLCKSKDREKLLIKAEAANGASNPIPHNYTLAGEKGVSLGNVLNEAVNINCINSQLLCTCLQNICPTKWNVQHKEYKLKFTGLLKEKHLYN